eukprot:jgi/Mesen1/4515/ME000023S03894
MDEGDVESWIVDTVGQEGPAVVRQVAARGRPHFLAPFGRRRHLPLFVYIPGLDGTLDAMEGDYDVRSLAIPPSDVSTYAQLAQRVADLITHEKQLRGDENGEKVADVATSSRWHVTVMAESFGAGVALQLAASQAPLVDYLILSNSGSGFRRAPLLRFGSLLVPWAPQLPEVHRLTSYALAPVLSNWRRLAERNRYLIVPPFSEEVIPQRAAAHRLRMMATWQPSDALLGQISAPTLLIASGADRLFPSVEEAYGLATCLTSCQIKILPFSGHVPFLEVPHLSRSHASCPPCSHS